LTQSLPEMNLLSFDIRLASNSWF